QLPDDPAQAQAAFDALSGEMHASTQTALIESSQFVRNIANDRLRAAVGTAGAAHGQATTDIAHAPRLAAGYGTGTASDASGVLPPSAEAAGPVFWSQAFGTWGSTDGDGNAAHLNHDTSGLLIGADRQLGAWRIGAMGGYSHTRFNAHDRASSGTADSLHLGVYGGRSWDALALRSGLTYSWHDLDTQRHVALPGLDDSLRSSTHAQTLQAFAELGYGLDLGEH